MVLSVDKRAANSDAVELPAAAAAAGSVMFGCRRDRDPDGYLQMVRVRVRGTCQLVHDVKGP